MKKLCLTLALAAVCAQAQETIERQNTEVHTLPDGSKVTVANTTSILYQEAPRKPQERLVRRTALFIRNDTGMEVAENAVNFIRNQVRSQVSKGDFEIIDFNDAVAAMRPMPDAVKSAEGVWQMRRYLSLQADLNSLQGNTSQKNLGGQGTTGDERLLAQSSIVRIAQQLEADYVMLLTLDGFEAEDFQNEDDPKRWWHKYTLDASYAIMDATGFSIGGDSMDVTLRYIKNARLTDKSYPNDLSREMAKKLAADMKKNAAGWRKSSLENSKVPVYIDATAMTMDRQPMYIQFDTTLEQVVVNEAQVPVRVVALVEVDGVAAGSTGSVFPMAPGLHKVRVWRDGMDDVSMTVNAKNDLKLVVPMRISEGEMLRVQALQKNIHDMTLAKETAQSIADMIRGKAEMFRNSHIRVDAANLPDTHVMQAVVPGNTTVVPVINNTATTVVQ